MTERLGLSQVVMTQQLSPGNEIDVLLQCSDSKPFGLAVTNLEKEAYRKISTPWRFFDIAYLLRAVEYHCLQLCRLYAEICEAFG